MPILAQPVSSRTFIRRLSSLGVAALSGLSLLADPASAATIRSRVSFDRSDARVSAAGTGPAAALRGALAVGGEEAPALPMVVKTFAIPEGFEVSGVRVAVVRESRLASDLTLRTRTSRALDPADVSRPYPAGALAEGGASTPAQPGVSLSGGSFGGFNLHSVGLFPMRYVAGTRELFFAEEMEIEIETRLAADGGALVRERRGTEAERLFAEAVRHVVENPGDVAVPAAEIRTEDEGGFAPRDLPSVDGSGVDMVIVTTPGMAASYQTLATWKTKKGTSTVVRDTGWIEANYPQGHDLTERIRLFLKDAYTKWGTAYVLLAGDYGDVPPRGAFNRFFFGGLALPTDQYFACLEGDWNDDGDALFGEGVYQAMPGDLVDLYPDLIVGRAPGQNVTEASTFVTKSMLYEKTPPAGYVKTHGVFGEVLFPHDWEYGDPPNTISLDGKTLAETLDAYVDPTWTRFKKYQSDNNQDRAICLAELHAGRHLQTIVGHGDAFKFSVGNGINPRIYVADTAALTNGNKLIYLVATACNPNQFDLECQGEAFMNKSGGGAIAVSGPTREDFPLSANDYHAVMYDYVFNEGVSSFGMMNQLKRVPFVPMSQTDTTPDRWTMLTSMLFGDPELRFWTDEPAVLLAAHPGSVALGTASITVTVTNASAVPQADALVCVSDAAGTYSRGRTNGAGQVTLPLTSRTTGTLGVVATKKNFKPYEGSTTLTTGVGPVIAISASSVDDDAVGPSIGNGDGRIDAGERIEIDFTARNAGNAIANTVNAAATLVAGSTATFDLTYGGVADVNKIFIGKGRVHPAAIPFTLDFGTPAIDYSGKPLYTVAPDPLLGDRGVFIWQDLEGWHVVWTSGSDAVTVAGTVTTNGKVISTSALEIENGETVSVNGPATIVTFSGGTSSTDLVDGFDMALADNTKLTLVNGAAALGNIAAGGTANGTITFDVAATARDGQLGYVNFAFTAAAGGPWSAIVPVAVSGPVLESIVHVLNDGTPPASGTGNGIAEVGETIQILPTVLNRGTGAAVSVDGVLTGGAGITVVDGADAYGDIAPLAQDTGTNGYTFTITSALGTSVTLTLTDSMNRNTVKVIDFVAPPTPANLDFKSTPTAITLTWDASPAVDLAGYNVYRSSTLNGTYTKRSFELLRAAPRFVEDGLALGTTFFYKTTAVDLSGNESARSAAIEAWTTQVQLGGWPKVGTGNVFGSVAIADADNSGLGELYLSSLDFNFYAFEGDGAPHGSFPFTTAAEVWTSPALADLDKDGDLEVLFGGNDTRFYAFKHDGTPHFGANPILIDLPGGGEEIRGAAAIADVDRDAQLEFFFGSNLGNVYGFNHDGTPIVPGNGLIFTAPPGNTSASIWGNLAIADLAGDGTREIVFTSWNDSLYVITPTGARVTGFPRGAGADFKRGPVIGDLDNDGTMEILAGNADSRVYCYNHNGSNYLPGGVFADLPDSVTSAPALANLDGDPFLEVVVCCHDGKIYAFNHDGTGFLQAGGLFVTPEPTTPAPERKMTASPIIADVDGDSDFEIFVGNHHGNFYGFHHTGVLMPGFPIKTDLQIHSTAAAGDLDGNGDIEVAFAAYDGSLHVLDFTGPATAAALPWPMLGQNIARTAVYGEAGPWQTGAEGLAPAVTEFALDQNTPNPFRGTTTIRFASPTEMPVALRVFDVNGRVVRTLLSGRVVAGRHSVSWDGRDDKGRATSAGVYFYRLDGESETLTRKSIRLK